MVRVQDGYDAVYALIRSMPANLYDPSYNDAVRNGYIWRGVQAYARAMGIPEDPESTVYTLDQAVADRDEAYRLLAEAHTRLEAAQEILSGPCERDWETDLIDEALAAIGAPPRKW